MVRAGLEGDIGRGTFNAMAATFCILQSHNFGMRAARLLRMPLAQNLALGIHNDATHPRIGRSDAQGLVGQAQGLQHEGADGHGAQ